MSYKSYQELLNEKRVWYKAAKQSYCPILNANIIFNSKGFHHLLFDGLGHPRVHKERMYRLGLLPLVIPVLKTAVNISEYVPQTYSKKHNKLVEYWILKETVGKQKTLVTVVLRRIGSGNITFYSVWKKRDKQQKSPL
jgi:hypothetical protein